MTWPSGNVTRLPAHEYGPLVAVYDYPEEFFSPRDVPAARTALRYLLWENRERAQTEAQQLSPQGKTFFELLFQHHIDVLSPVLLRGIRKYHDVLAAISPHGHLSDLKPRSISCTARRTILFLPPKPRGSSATYLRAACAWR